MLINVNEKRMRLTLAVKMRDNEQFLQNFKIGLPQSHWL